ALATAAWLVGVARVTSDATRATTIALQVPRRQTATRGPRCEAGAATSGKRCARRTLNGNADRALKKLFCGKTRDRAGVVRWGIAIAEWLSRVLVSSTMRRGSGKLAVSRVVYYTCVLVPETHK